MTSYAADVATNVNVTAALVTLNLTAYPASLVVGQLGRIDVDVASKPSVDVTTAIKESIDMSVDSKATLDITVKTA